MASGSLPKLDSCVRACVRACERGGGRRRAAAARVRDLPALGWLAHWLAGWLAGWLTGWLAGSLAAAATLRGASSPIDAPVQWRLGARCRHRMLACCMLAIPRYPTLAASWQTFSAHSLHRWPVVACTPANTLREQDLPPASAARLTASCPT